MSRTPRPPVRIRPLLSPPLTRPRGSSAAKRCFAAQVEKEKKETIIDLTKTVRGFLSPERADVVLAALTVATRDVSINGKPPVHWHIDQKRSILRSYLHLSVEKLDDGLLHAALVIGHPDNASVATDIPEEHCWLTVKDGHVWTVADLCMIDENTFYSAECLLSTAAYQRVAERLRAENPSGWRTWQRWPAREFAAV